MGTTYIYNADSWDEFLSDLKTNAILPAWESDAGSLSGSESFSQSKSWEHSLDMAERGWHEGREALHAAMFKTVTDRMPEFDLAPAGFMPCIPAYAIGIPEDMFCPSEFAQEVPKPIVRIVVNITASGCVEAEHLANRGAAIVQLIDRIQLAGQRVELVAVFGSDHRSKGQKTLCTITVKRPEEPVDLDRISYAIAHPAMLRRSLFRVMEFTVPHRVSGYGVPMDSSEFYGERDIYIKSMMSDSSGFESREQAVKTVNKIWEKAAQAA